MGGGVLDGITGQNQVADALDLVRLAAEKEGTEKRAVLAGGGLHEMDHG